jgi:phosphate transport system permease protein
MTLAAEKTLDITQSNPSQLALEQGFIWLSRGMATVSAAILLAMAAVIFQMAQPAIAQFGLGFIIQQEWDTGNLLFGAQSYIYGTLVSSFVALGLAMPIGIAVALVTSENILPVGVRSPLALLVETIASIPSVIIGFWGIMVLIPALLPLQQWLYKAFGWLPLFGTEPAGPSMLMAGIVLAVMILPTIAAISRDVLQAVPPEYRSASMALGATRWEAILTVLLPSSATGILGAVLLALGRALGETMAVTMVIGNADQLSLSLLNPANTIPALLANQFPEALEALHVGALMYLALILFALTLLVNMLAVGLTQWLNRRLA